MTDVYFDLSELFLNSGVRFKYYGISRTVMEVAYEMVTLHKNIRFVVYSPLHRRFFEVFPRIGADSPTGVLDHNLPLSATPVRLRQNTDQKSLLVRLFYKIAGLIVDFRNQRRWNSIPEGSFKDVDLNSKLLISLGRPKIMSDYLLALQKSGVKPVFVPLLHDLIPLHDFKNRGQFSFPANFLHDNKVIIEAASLILANSSFTKGEIVAFSQRGILPPVPEVVAIPLCHQMRNNGETISKSAPVDRYLLCVGSYNGRKNLECVVEAMLQLQTRGADVPALVLAGARRKKVDKFLADSRFANLQQKIHFVYDPNQAELEKLYRDAYALVLPSKMEGWGLPVSEALWCGTPALAADVPALREAGGELAKYFDPEQPSSLTDLIEHLMSHPSEYKALKADIIAGHNQLRTWKDVASDIVHAIDVNFAFVKERHESA
ncbi:glycosyltransferase family 1 protein [Rhizobium sp.]|uniref:glycosyltransferase family 4 protein n=1 Tax=Rhizobium sp. TaxID=391 RepID=UPI000E8F1E92|nr:glycosyltransferase family 1 protein [Rhizobium sp.]